MNIAELLEAKNPAAYVPHKLFAGVYLKHLILAADSGGQISSHLVKVEPFCCLDTHSHTGQAEIHTVIGGSGEGQIAEQKYDYLPGVITVTPPDVPHKVTAGPEGMYILASFSPALL